MTNWETQSGRYPRDPRYGHRVGCNYIPINKMDLFSTSDGFIANKSKSGLSAITNDHDLVFIIGGSAAMGYGVKNEHTLSSCLQRKLDQELPERSLKVVNAACAGWGSWTELLYLTLELIHYSPKYVIQLTGWNDFVHSSIGSKRSSAWYPNHDRSIEDVFEAVKAGKDFFSMLSFHFAESSFYHRLKYFYSNLKGKKFTMSDIRWGHDKTSYKYKQNSIQNLINNIVSARSICNGHTIDFTSILQPVIFLSEDSTRIPPHTQDWSNKYHGFSDSLTKFYSELENKISTQRPSRVFNFSSSKRFCKETYIDHCHFSPVGNKLLADLIFDIQF